MTKTRYEGLSFERQGRSLWRFIDEETGRAVGQHYRTRAELLADLVSFAETFCSGRARS